MKKSKKEDITKKIYELVMSLIFLVHILYLGINALTLIPFEMYANGVEFMKVYRIFIYFCAILGTPKIAKDLFHIDVEEKEKQHIEDYIKCIECSNCHAIVPEESNYCMICGAKFEE